MRPMFAPVLAVGLALASLFGLAACSEDCGTCTKVDPAAPAVEQAWRGTGDVIQVTAWELTCKGCVRDIEKSIAAIDGVVSVKADDATSEVTVKIADAAQRDAMIPKLRAAIKKQSKSVLGEDPDA